LLDYYIGQVGVQPKDFWSYTWAENQLLGEAHTIKQNLEWERTRYVATMLFNINCSKRAQMITPDKLFPLPQDVYLERGKPKSEPKQAMEFLKRVEQMKKQKGQ
jgi:hypothetical protein|tara:strand:+ start:3493 stop:3804 length:312 start_codon:yes stop_codon:yes gene_type:complete